MLVAEDRNDFADPLERGGDPVEEPFPGILSLLCIGRIRIVAMLTDAQHTVDLQFVRAQCDGVVDRFTKPESMFLLQAAAEIVARDLVVEHRNDFQIGSRAPVLPPAFEHLADDHVGV